MFRRAFMRGDPPTADYVLAERLKMTVAAVNAMDPDERIGWHEYLQVQSVLATLAAKTEAARAG